MSDLERIKITAAEVSDTRVDDLVARDREARRPVAPVQREQARVPFYYNPIYVYTFFAGLAAFGVWAAFESSFKEGPGEEHDEASSAMKFLLFPTMGAAIGLMIAMADALLSRNFQRALLCGGIGLGLGFVVGVVGMIAAGAVMLAAVFLITATGGMRMDGPHGIGLFIFMAGRTLAWTFAASGMGIGQGVALKSKKLVLNGIVGGLLGGFLGGIAFDPICFALGNPDTALLSRLIGFTTIGLAVGFFTGLVENMAKDAWLYMKAGPLAGKQFVIYKDPTVLGSSPKCDVYLFKDAAIEPQHAELRAVGTRLQLKDLGTRQGTFVNGRKVETHMLEPGDTVVLGETVLEYAERERK
ncbi:MAG: FHA domain-containing protein [Planctomycetota bacterium]